MDTPQSQQPLPDGGPTAEEQSTTAAPPTAVPPTTAEADALVDALGRLRGPRGHRGPGGGPFGMGGGPFGMGGGRRGMGGMGGVGSMGGFEGRGFPDQHRPHDPHEHPGQRGPRERTGGPALVRLLGVLAHSEEPLSISQLAEHIGVDQPRASRLVQQAVEAGHAVREADPGDARRTRVRLTASGEQLVHGVRSRQREHASTALAALAPGERAELLRLMAKLAQAWPRE